MADETKTPDPAPAVHTGRMWEIPAGETGVWIHNIAPEPIFIETQQQYFAELNARGMRMKDQQESFTGPERELPVEVPAELLPSKPVVQISQREAHVFGAMRAFFTRYNIHEALYCNECFIRKRHSGCNCYVTSSFVSIQCRCGIALYKALPGTTDLLPVLVSTAITAADTTVGTVLTPMGPEFKKTVVLHDREASLLFVYFRILSARSLEPKWRHPDYDGPISDDRFDLPLSINEREGEIYVITPPVLLVWRRLAVAEPMPAGPSRPQ